MTLIVVIDPRDDVEHTAFINRLQDLERRRAVAHAPASGEGLVNDILRALGKTEYESPAGPARRRSWADAWLHAHDRLDLVVYGAWRLPARDLAWLRDAAASPTLRVWLVAYADACNRMDLIGSADIVWSWEQFRGYWQTRLRNQRHRARARAREWELPPIDVAERVEPWPWGIARALSAPASRAAALGVANRIGQKLQTRSLNHILLAELIVGLFSQWRTPRQRSFALMVLKDDLFVRSQTWFDWDPALVRMRVARPLVDAQIHRGWADPAIAARAVVIGAAASCSSDTIFEIGHDASHVILSSGEAVASCVRHHRSRHRPDGGRAADHSGCTRSRCRSGRNGFPCVYQDARRPSAVPARARRGRPPEAPPTT